MIMLRYRTLVAFLAGITLVIVAGFAFQSWRADAAPGDSDATLVPITPCRLVDTRPAPDRIGPNGAFGIGDTRTIAAHGTNGQCTIPTDAVALSLNVTAVGATAPTFLTIWPGGPLPKASSLNPFPGQPPTPNAVTVDLSAGGTFNIYNLAGTVDVIVDVNGYYIRSTLKEIQQRLLALEAANAARSPMYWAVVGADGSLVRGSPGATATQLFKPGVDGSYEVDFGTNLSNCLLLATMGRTDDANLDPGAGEIGTAYRNGKPTAVYVKTRNSDGAFADRSFHLAVIC
jgi:hypothetical protein